MVLTHKLREDVMPNLGDYGIDLAQVQDDPIEAIKSVLATYEASAKSYRDNGDKATTGVKAVVAMLKDSDPATVSLTDSLVSEIREVIYRTLMSDPSVSVLLFDAMQEIKDGISSFRGEVIKSIGLTEESDADDSQVDLDAKFEEVEFLHKALANFVNFAQMNGLKVSDLPSSLRKVGQKSGKMEVSLPRKPNGPETGSDTVKGRHASVYKMNYTLNTGHSDEVIPSGISLNRIALFYCSTPDTWLNGSELMDLVKRETGGEWGAGDWTVKVPAGTLSAKKVSA